MGEPVMHHYLPQCYLRGFSKQGFRDQKGALRVIDLIDGKCYTANVKQVAKIRDFYLFINKDGKPDNRLETEVFQKVDSLMATVLRELDNTNKLPRGDAWTVTAGFIAFLQLRTPRFRHANQEITQHLFDVFFKTSTRSREVFEQTKIAFTQATGEQLDISYEEMLATVNDGEGFRVDTPRTNDIGIMLEVVPEITKLIEQMTPSLAIAKGEGPFILGDSPVSIMSSNEDRIGIRGVGWRSKDVDVTVPLTSRHCLGLSWVGPSLTIGITDHLVAMANTNQLIATRRFLFAPSSQIPFYYGGEVLWGEEKVLEVFSEIKKTQPAVRINGGGVEQRSFMQRRR